MSNFWDNNDTVSEYELMKESIDEMEKQHQEMEIVEYEDIDKSQVQAIQQESSFELTEKETTVVYNARLRLEQARLYEMLINHNLFEGIDADKQAIQNVQNELKEYIVYRLEILLGLRKRIPKEDTVNQQTDTFNDTEVDFLKQLAYMGTKRASLQPKESNLNPIGGTQINNNKLKTLSVTSNNIIDKPTKTIKKTMNKQVPISKKNIEVPQQKVHQKIKSDVGTRNLTPSEIEAIAKEDLKLLKNKKKWTEMTLKEKMQEVKQVNERHSKKIPENRIPMPSPEQQEMMYQMQQANRLQFGNDLSKFNMMVANALAVKKQQEPGGYDD